MQGLRDEFWNVGSRNVFGGCRQDNLVCHVRPSRANLQGWEPPPAGEGTRRSARRPGREQDDSTLPRNALHFDG